jgi:hypothetical protein
VTFLRSGAHKIQPLTRRFVAANDSIRRNIFESLSAKVQFLPERQFRTCWRTHRFDFNALQEEAHRNNPAFDAKGVKPRIHSPASNSAVDFFVVINAGPRMRLASDQIETDGLYRFEKLGETRTNCDGGILADRGQAITFGKAYPSDHCPILLSVSY